MSLLIQPARQEDFLSCREQVFERNFLQHGIGSLAEKSQHAILKNYYCPNPAEQEINLGPFVADIANREGVTEIQTRGFGSMRKKLGFFLQHYPVRVIYPAAAVKWVVWVDPQTGETVARNRSPKKTAAYGIFRELYSVLDLLWPAGFSVTIALLECEEYRLLNGRGPAHKKGAQRLELIPPALLGELVLHRPRDLLQFLPDGLPERFTSGDLQKSIRLNARSISYLILVLRRLELIEQVGKQERFHLYQIRA